MEDPNFEFLKNDFPLFYKYCKKMDYFIFDEEYDEAALNSRKAVEGMVKAADKHFNPKTYVDYSTTYGKKPFKQHYNDLYDQGYCNEDIRDSIKKIWNKGGESAHPTFKNFKREELNLIAESTHKIVKHFFKEINPLMSISSLYNRITGVEEWIKERKGNSEDIKSLNEEINRKEKENIKIRTELSDLAEDLKNSQSEMEHIKKKHEEELSNLRREGNEHIEKYKARMDEKEKALLQQVKDLENKYNVLKDDFDLKEQELSDEKNKLKAKIDNSDIYDIEDVGVFKSRPVLEIKYPPMVLPERQVTEKEEQIDPSQIEATYSDSDYLVIDAGPGSGKTKVIVDRLKFLLEKHNPDSFLVITFTDKAANELKKRLKEKLEKDYSKADKIHVSTIHSFCRTFLRDNSSMEINILDENKERIFIKNTFAEKFSGASYISSRDYKAVFDRFDEASRFDCDYDRWIKSIKSQFCKSKKKRDANEEFIKFLEGEGLGQDDFVFPEETVRNNPNYNKSWYAYKYLAIAEAAKEYHEEILKDNSLYNFNRLQTATLEFLRKNKDDLKIQYKNILIDEFQDTDVIQKEIFEILLENADTFTIVGDMDQSIYRWRGSNYKYLDEFADKPGFEKVILNKNYRSGKNIVEFNESFINRPEDEKSLTSGKMENDGAVYYLDNMSLEMQAENIVKTIKYLHDKKGVKYSDIGLLFRSTMSHKVNHLIHRLKDEGINYTIKGNKDLDSEKYLEIRGILYLLWYITDSMNYFDLDQFLYATDPFYKFSEYTRNILINQRMNPHELSKMSRSELESLDIDSFDLEFILKLNLLKKAFYLDSGDNKITILGVFNKLLNITGYVDEQFRESDENGYNDKNNYMLLNLGLISEIIKNYMDTVDKYDIEGLFAYLVEEYGNYSSPYNDKDKDGAVQILTIFKAKGLEFPVVFLCSLQKNTLPKSYIEKRPDKNLNSKYIEYPISNRFLRFKPKEKHEREEHRAEERRVIYVANTRAKDLLIVSGVLKDYKAISPELREIKTKVDQLNINDLDSQLKDLKIKASSDFKLFKKPELSFSSFNTYTECKHKYDLKYNFGFEVDSSEKMELGTIVHDLLNKIHIKAKIDGFVEDEFMDEIFENVYENNPFIIEKEYDSIIESIRDYWEDYGQEWKIIDSEFPFSIKGDKYDFNGVIDLIVQEDPEVNEISIIDFKTTSDDLLDKESINEKYQSQLQLYAHALSNDPHFKDFTITNLKIFQIDGEDIYDDEENNFEIDQEQTDVLINSLEYAVDEIYDGIFDKNLEHCKSCMYKELCNVIL